MFPDFALTDDIGRPVDQIAGGMDGRGRANPETPYWVLDQLLTAEQALRAVTLDAAFALGDETRRGHLAPGTLGDVTILSGDVTDRHARRDPGLRGRRDDRGRHRRLLLRSRSLRRGLSAAGGLEPCGVDRAPLRFADALGPAPRFVLG